MNAQLRQNVSIDMRSSWLTRAHLWYVLPVCTILIWFLLFALSAPTAWQLQLGDSRYTRGTIHGSDEDIAPYRWTEPKVRLQPPLFFDHAQQLVLGLRSGRNDAAPLQVRIDSEGTKSFFSVSQTPRIYRMLTKTTFSSDQFDVTMTVPEFREKRDKHNGVVQKYGLMIREFRVVPTTNALAWWNISSALLFVECVLVFAAMRLLFNNKRATGIVVALWLPLQSKVLNIIDYERHTSIVALITCAAIIVFTVCFYLSRPFVVRSWASLVAGGYIPYERQIRAGYTRFWQHARLRDDIVITSWDRADWLIAAGFALAAALIRVPLIGGVAPLLNGDDYETGSLAVNILHGYHLLYYGWRVGTLTAYLIAPLFLVAPTTLPALFVLPITLSAVLVVGLYGLGRDLFGRWGGIGAAAWMALPSATAMRWTLKPQAGYLEIITLGTLLLWMIVRLCKAQASQRSQMLLMIGIGIVTACVVWVNFVVISILVVCGWIVVSSWRRLGQFPMIGYILGACFFIVIWFVPLVIYTLDHPSANPIWYALHPPYNETPFGIALKGLTLEMVPLLIGIVPAMAGHQFVGLISTMLYLSVLIPTILILYHIRNFYHSAITIMLLSILPVAAFLSSPFRYLFSDIRYILPVYLSLALMIGFSVYKIRQLRYGKLYSIIFLIAVVSVNSINVSMSIGFAKTYQERSEATVTRALQQSDIRYVHTSFWNGMGIIYESGGDIITSSLVGPSRTTFDPRNEDRVLAAEGQQTAFVFKRDSVGRAPFERYLQAHAIVCEEQSVREYMIYTHCSPFPNVMALVLNLPEYPE